MANTIKARKCLLARSPSDWVFKIFLTCDNKLAVWFRHGQKVKKIAEHGPGAYLGHGGYPNVVCLYPNTAGKVGVDYYNFAQVWPYAGEWVHRFLYKKFGYVFASAPTDCGNCNTQCSLSANPTSPSAGQVVTFTATITNTDGSSASGACPEGSVTFSVDGAAIGTQTIAANYPPSTNAATVAQTWTAAGGTHTITAVYTPQDGFAATSCQMSLTVGIQTSCCPGVSLPPTLHATISNGSGCSCLAGTYALNYGTWSAGGVSGPGWLAGTGNLCGETLGDLLLRCNPNGPPWDWEFWLLTSHNEEVFYPAADCNTPSWTLTNVQPQYNFCPGGTFNVSVTT